MLITADNIDISPLKQAIADVVPPATSKDFELFFVVKETPVSGVLQVTLAVFSALTMVSNLIYLVLVILELAVIFLMLL